MTGSVKVGKMNRSSEIMGHVVVVRNCIAQFNNQKSSRLRSWRQEIAAFFVVLQQALFCTTNVRDFTKASHAFHAFVLRDQRVPIMLAETSRKE